MYNQELKERYLSEKENQIQSTISNLRYQFEKTEKFEEMNGKDLCNWTTEEIIEYYKYSNYTSINTLTVHNSYFSLYTQWCLQNSLVNDHQNHFNEIDIKVMNACINPIVTKDYVITRDMLIDKLKLVENPSDRFIILGAFEGISSNDKNYKEFRSAKISDVDPVLMKIRLYGEYGERTINISKDLVNIAYESAEDFLYYKSNGRAEKLDSDHDLIIKPVVKKSATNNDFYASRSIYTRFKKQIKIMDLPETLNMKDLKQAGRIDMIKREMERTGKNLEEILLDMTPRKAKGPIYNQYGVLGCGVKRFVEQYGNVF